MKTQIIALAFISYIFLAGCDSSSTNSSQNSMSEDIQVTNITVERGPVLEALVRDANGRIGQHLGNGVYSFNDIVYPVQSYGGYIDMNRNGVVDAGDVEMGQLRLRTRAGTVMTLATTMDENQTDSFLDIGFTKERLSSQTPSSDLDIAALSDEVYKFCYENNISDPATIGSAQMHTLQNRIQERKSLYAHNGKSSVELENILIDDLNITKLSQEDIDNLPTDSVQTIIDATPVSELSNEQKYTLAFMWNEERLARDLYLALNALTPSQTLYNIATKAEAQHVLSVEALLKKYDLNILNTDDYSGGYSQEVLSAYNDGSYTINEISELYDTLYTRGSTSLQSALEVGCMVEVTDINDLNADLELVDGVDDITVVFENLRKGSYSHYWAFDKALKAQGTTDGCCSLGEEYCKTVEEYPQSNGSSGNSGSGNGQQHGKNSN